MYTPNSAGYSPQSVALTGPPRYIVQQPVSSLVYVGGGGRGLPRPNCHKSIFGTYYSQHPPNPVASKPRAFLEVSSTYPRLGHNIQAPTPPPAGTVFIPVAGEDHYYYHHQQQLQHQQQQQQQLQHQQQRQQLYGSQGFYSASTLPARSYFDRGLSGGPSADSFVLPKVSVNQGGGGGGGGERDDVSTPPFSHPAPLSIPRPALQGGNSETAESDPPRPTDAVKKKIVKLPIGCTGLLNLGNTCYMNSVLQCLSHTKDLVDYCSDQNSKKATSKSKCQGVMVKALVELFKDLRSGAECVDPSSFRKKIIKNIDSFQDLNCQQDAQEFLLALLGSLHEDLKQKALKKKHQSIRLYTQSDKRADTAWKEYLGSENGVVVDIFMGQQKSSLTCCSCNNVSHTFEPALGLSLPIPSSENGVPVTLANCLAQYFHDETLGGDEKPACDNCKQKSDAKKRLKLQKFPKIFVILLNRFSNELSATSKITTPVQYPITNLNFKEFAHVDANVIYNLYAVVEHMGTMHNGHYVAIIRNRLDGQWYLYDDDIVRQIPEHMVVSQSAYILFYELHSAEKEKNNSSNLSLRNLFISS